MLGRIERRISRAEDASVEFRIMEDSSGLDEVKDVPVHDGEAESQNGAEAPEPMEGKKDDLPIGFLKELKRRDRKYSRDVGALHEQLAQLKASMGASQNQAQDPSNFNAGAPNVQGMSVEHQIQTGVRMALEAQEAQKRKAEEAERMAHVHRQYERMNQEFDKASDKYDDFDEKVRGSDAPFTPTMRDALLLIDNPADVAYKLAKNRDELSRISKLHPLDQAREVNKLSFALMGVNGASSAPSHSSAKPMEPIKANPVTSSASQSAAAIRARMKAGTWK